MFTICICLRLRDSLTIQATVIYLHSQVISDMSVLTFDLDPVLRNPETVSQADSLNQSVKKSDLVNLIIRR